MSLEFHDVSVSIQDVTAQGVQTRTILHPLTAALEATVTSIIGSNGSGKSTFLQLTNGLVEASQGAVLVNGLDPREHGARVRRQVGFVFTDPAAQLVMPTVIEDVELSLRRIQVPRRECRARGLAVLEELGIADLADRSVYELSGGQRQLAALASVLAVDPAVLVLDEPTTLLDLRNRELLRVLLARLARDRDLRILVSTHDLEMAADAQETLLFNAGKLVAHGAPAEVIAEYREQVTASLSGSVTPGRREP